MSGGIDQLGNGVGYIYLTNSSNAIIGNAIPNTEYGYLHVRRQALVGSPMSGGRRCVAYVKIDSINGAVNLTALNVSGVQQLGGTVAATYTPAVTDAYDTAVSIAASITAHTPAGTNWVAYAKAEGNTGVVVIEGPPDTLQSPLNGAAVSLTWSNPANVTMNNNSDVITHSGSDAGDNYDNRFVESGTRVWLDASLAASATVLDTGSAVEITREINLRGQQHPIDVQTVTISGNTVSFDRVTNETMIIVQGGGANLDTLSVTGAQEGDVIHLCGYASGNGIVVRDYATATDPGKNIYTPGGASVTSNDATTILTLTYLNDNTNGYGYYPISETMPISEATVRAGGLATPSVTGVEEVTPVAGGGTFTIRAGGTGTPPANTTYKSHLRLTGTVTLTGNYNIAFNTTDMKDGDCGFIDTRALAITNGGGQLIINGQTINDEIALNGNFIVRWTYGGASPALSTNLAIDPQDTGWIQDAMIPNLEITGAKLAATTIPAGKYAAGSIATADLDPGNINLNTVGLAGSISTALLDATLQGAIGNTKSSGKVSIANAAVLTLNGTPVQLVAAPGAGKAIVPFAVIVRHNFVTAAFATNTTLEVYVDTSSKHSWEDDTILLSASTSAHKMWEPGTNPTAAEIQMVENKAIMVRVATGNPTGGGGSLDFWVAYYEFDV